MGNDHDFILEANRKSGTRIESQYRFPIRE